MALMLRRDENMGDGRTVWPKKDERKKTQGPALISARMPCEPTHDLVFTARLAKTRLSIPPFNIDINPWRRLGHTVLVFQAESNIWVEYRMPVPDTVVNPIVRRG